MVTLFFSAIIPFRPASVWDTGNYQVMLDTFMLPAPCAPDYWLNPVGLISEKTRANFENSGATNHRHPPSHRYPPMTEESEYEHEDDEEQDACALNFYTASVAHLRVVAGCWRLRVGCSQNGAAATKPNQTTHRTASTQSTACRVSSGPVLSLSLRLMLARWASTVLALMPRRRVISFVSLA